MRAVRLRDGCNGRSTLVDGFAGSAATYASPPIVKVTEAVGIAGTNAAPDAAPAVTAKSPAASAFTVTTANLIDPSSHLVFTSVCVGSDPTLNPSKANPFGTTCPKVTQPGVRPTVAIVAIWA